MLDEMKARKLELSSFSFNPFIREFGRWTMIDEVRLRMWGISRNFRNSYTLLNSIHVGAKLGMLLKVKN